MGYWLLSSWMFHLGKSMMINPIPFSNSLDIRLARTLINIAGENDISKTIIDPCCGMGTVVLEGLALGYSIKGFDISRDISWKARCNLNHFGFDGMLITKDDINKHQGHYDVAIIDIPYNLYTPITYQEQCAIIQSARRLCDKLVLVSYEKMDQEIKEASFEIKDRILRKKTELVKFGRYIYVWVIKKMYDFMSYIFLHKFCYLRSKNICINKENNLIFKIILETLINRRRKPNIILSMFF